MKKLPNSIKNKGKKPKNQELEKKSLQTQL